MYQTVKIGKQVWMAENLRVTKYRNGLPIVSIVRHSQFDDLSIRKDANDFIIQKANDLVDYDWKGSPGAFLGICGNGPQNWYCSEMGENIVNKYGNTWDNWQLKRTEKKARIAPIEIHFGKNACQVNNFITDPNDHPSLVNLQTEGLN